MGDDVILIVMDSEWWLYPGAKPGLESSCDQKTEDEVLAEIKDIAAANPGKLLVFAAHHPCAATASMAGTTRSSNIFSP